MNLSKGCFYCKNLECTVEPLKEFECAVNKDLKINNVGACFVAKIGEVYVVIENCPSFKNK